MNEMNGFREGPIRCPETGATRHYLPSPPEMGAQCSVRLPEVRGSWPDAAAVPSSAPIALALRQVPHPPCRPASWGVKRTVSGCGLFLVQPRPHLSTWRGWAAIVRESLGDRAPGICSTGAVRPVGTEVAVLQEEGFILSDPEKREGRHATRGHTTRGHTKRLRVGWEAERMRGVGRQELLLRVLQEETGSRSCRLRRGSSD